MIWCDLLPSQIRNSLSLNLQCVVCFSVVDGDADGLKQLLIFVTGMDSIPALGFMPQPSVTFRHKADLDCSDPTWEFPLANTCSNSISLPCSLTNYGLFKDRMMAAVSINVFTLE